MKSIFVAGKNWIQIKNHIYLKYEVGKIVIHKGLMCWNETIHWQIKVLSVSAKLYLIVIFI
jgi:hypothetical protein